MDDKRLEVLGIYTPEGSLTLGYHDHYLFFVGRDDIHSILLTLINNEKLEIDFNMFGFDDDTLNEAILNKLKDPSIVVKGTLDKSQAGGVHEKKLLSLDETNDPSFLNSIAIGQSATHQISHTKGAVLVGQGIWFEGSTNWSNSGEGTGISLKANVKNPVGWTAQNNTLLVSVNLVGLSRFKTQLSAEHLIAQRQGGGK
jgi:hypothetical protein